MFSVALRNFTCAKKRKAILQMTVCISPGMKSKIKHELEQPIGNTGQRSIIRERILEAV
jgi:hypothetical protein